ncbi:MAG: GtrA family protein [Desulfovibrionaceae bacterium]|nr:GtrA family protein [Desulfovibrionaceae bacterium]
MLNILKLFSFNKTTFKQIIRYGIVGILHNAAGYILYLIITALGVDPKIVVGFTYPIALLISYIGNKKYTFENTGNYKKSSLRFLGMHCISYLINLGLLYVLVDLYGFPHQIIQLMAIFVCAAFLFVTLKLYVFKKEAPLTGAPS